MPDFHQTRRHFLKTIAAGGASVAVLSPFVGCRQLNPMRQTSGDDGAWVQVPRILEQIQPPTFPERDFDITDYGAQGDGSADNTAAFEEAVAACADAGGGRVVVPEGRFLTGPIHLRSNVNLHVTDDATVAFSRKPNDYLPAVYTRWEGVEAMNYSPLIYAFEEENVAVTGGGTLDGQADRTHWWPWKGEEEGGWMEGEPNQDEARSRLMAMAEDGVPVRERTFGEGDYLRPQFIQPYRCQNVLIEGVTIRRSPMWNLHLALCTNVTVRGVTVDSHGPNNDGCNPESSRNVLIEDCYFDTGDDCIAIKAGRNADGRRVDTPCENVVVRGCTMRDGHGGVVMGSEMTGGVRNVFAEDCQMDSPNLDRILRIKTNSVRGGFVENVNVRNIDVGEVGGAAVLVNFFYEEGDAGAYTPRVERIDVRDIACQRCERVFYLRGYEENPIRDVRLVACRFEETEESSIVENVENVTLEEVYVEGELIRDPTQLTS